MHKTNNPPELSKPGFQYSSKEYIKYDRIEWESIYKNMQKDLHLRKILKKNNYYALNTSDINQASKILDSIPLKEDLKVQYFTENYQKNLSKYLNNQINSQELINNLNFPRLTACKRSLVQQSTSPKLVKRLNIRDIKSVINRLNILSNEKKIADSSSLMNNSLSTAEPSQRMDLNASILLKKNEENLNSNALEPNQLKYSIIKNLILEKFKEREHRKKEKNTKKTTFKSNSNENKLPKIIYGMQAIEEDFLQKIQNKNLSSVNPRHHSFYLRYERKLSDGLLKSERKPLSLDSKEVPYKKIIEDFKARNLMNSNLKYNINKSADGYIEAFKHFKNLSRSFNKNIILKDINKINQGKKCSLGIVDHSKTKKNPLGLWHYLHHSNLIHQHKVGLISNIGISDMMMDKNQKKNDFQVEKKVRCERDLRDMIRNDKILEEKKALRDGEFSRLANNMLKNNEIKMKPLRVCKKYHGRKKEEEIERTYDEGNDSLQSINENKLDCLYNESINLQKNLTSKERSSFSDKIKRFIKLEELNKAIIEVNNRKLKNQISN